MVDRLWVALAALALACGGAEDNGITDWQESPQAGSGGQAGAPVSGGEVSQAGATQEGGAAAGGVTSAAGKSAGADAGAGTSGAGMSQGGAGASSGGATQGGSGGTPQAGAGGKTDGGTGGGTGGKPGDELEPKPAENCPGYVDVLVPVGTCLWIHGTFTRQTESCNLHEPPEQKCMTVSAATKPLMSRVSESAVIDRFDFAEAGCPKQCN